MIALGGEGDIHPDSQEPVLIIPPGAIGIGLVIGSGTALRRGKLKVQIS